MAYLAMPYESSGRSGAASLNGSSGLSPYTAIEDAKTNTSTPLITDALIRLTLPMTLFV